MRVDVRVTKTVITFRPIRPVKLEGWSGVYSGKIVYDSLTRAGCVVEEGGFFRVTPLWTSNNTLAGGILMPGLTYRFETVFWGSSRTEYVTCMLHGISRINEPLELIEVRVAEEKLDIEIPSEGDHGEPVAQVYRVKHYPTFYRFHGAIVAYPSPRRMIASSARRLIEAMGGKDAAGLLAEEVKNATLRLAEHIELYRDKTRRQKVRISHGKDQPIFHGTAEYIVVAPRKLAEFLRDLLRVAHLLGLGGSPGLGLGHVYEVKMVEPRHELPKPVKVGEESDTLI